MSEFSSARTIAEQVASGRIRALDVCEAALARIDALDNSIHAFLHVSREYALGRARQVDEQIAAGREAGILAGVPIALKDNICTSFAPTTCASRALADYRSPFDATVVERIERAGGVIVGKTNLDEFAMGSSTENSSVRPVRNPWQLERVPGGSSGGSAAAVAARMAPLALGSDTGGSVRLPASLCGVVGVKPTYGRVSRYGLVAYASSLDQIGPIATNTADAALLLEVIAGRDARDSTMCDESIEPFTASLADGADCRGLRIGVPSEYFGEGLAPDVRSAIEQALDVYRGLGATVSEVSLPHSRYCVASYYLIATAECSSNLARFDGVHYGRRAEPVSGMDELYARSRGEGLGAEVKRRIMLGTFALSAGYYDAYYDKASRVRRLIREDFDRAFDALDLLACPTSPTTAFPLGEKTGDPLQMYLADVHTTAANLAGIPAVSIPCGFDRDGLPIGMQLLARRFDESALLRAASLFESATEWHARIPPPAD